MAEGFPKGTTHCFSCRTCKTFWQENKDNYTQCPACKRQAVKLYQCYECNTLTLETTYAERQLPTVQLKSFECIGCLTILAANAIRLAHSCEVVSATIFTTQSECRFCGEELQSIKKKTPKFPQLLKKQKPEALTVAAPVIQINNQPPILLPSTKEAGNPPIAVTPKIEIIKIPDRQESLKPKRQSVMMIVGTGLSLVIILMIAIKGFVLSRKADSSEQLAITTSQVRATVSIAPTPSASIPNEKQKSPSPSPSVVIEATKERDISNPVVKSGNVQPEKPKSTPTPVPVIENNSKANEIVLNTRSVVVKPMATPEPTPTPLPLRPPPSPTPVPRATNGVIRLNQALAENELVDVGSQLPGWPVLIDSVEPQCCVGLAGRPSPSNGWRKLVLRGTKKITTGIIIRWRTL